MIKKINHVAVVVPDLAAARHFWVDALGLAVGHEAHVPAEDVNVAFLLVGDSEIELLQPTNDESGVARYLARRGPGLHHLCLEVTDIAAVLARLKAAEIPLINEAPVTDEAGRQYAFVHPKGTGGVLVELYELPGSALAPQ